MAVIHSHAGARIEVDRIVGFLAAQLDIDGAAVVLVFEADGARAIGLEDGAITTDAGLGADRRADVATERCQRVLVVGFARDERGE